jgi:acyl-CoA thioester hydrolase
MKQYICTIKSKVRYAETDQMGYVYYGHYALYCEDARIAALETLGVPYHLLEKQCKIGLPVIRYSIEFKQAFCFGDICEIKVFISEYNLRKIIFVYELHKENRMVAFASTELMFMNLETKKLINCPTEIFEKLTKKLKEEKS